EADQPEVSFDGSTIAFTAYAEKHIQQVHLVNPDGSNIRKLTSSDISATEPSWSPDGTKIVFTRIVGQKLKERVNIFQMNSDGGNVRRLTAGPVGDQRPCFSPDGSKIAFESNRDGNYEIYVRKVQ
ncbi:MAG TPA: hypothetical protein VFB70_18880, partial [Pyrinomonadaceae bacterium]|nr:hypothetical protein [Pyrinomonadaceae bacterium]